MDTYKHALDLMTFVFHHSELIKTLKDIYLFENCIFCGKLNPLKHMIFLFKYSLKKVLKFRARSLTTQKYVR